jgi:hypothetical protein
MKTIPVLLMLLTVVLLSPKSLHAEEPGHKMKCACMIADEAKMAGENKMMQQKMEAQMKAEAEEFDKLIAELNASTGDKKVATMAAIINKMAQKQKEMKAKCDMMMGMMKKDGKPEAKPGATMGEVDYYTCKMHPSVHWPIPGKCPICSMDLVPVFKKARGTKTGAKPEAEEAKQGEEVKKAEDPHAEHKH